MAAAACVRAPPPLIAPEPFAAGAVSFYARELQGHLTASGERYDERRLTAAHRSLPFGSCVEVENVENGRRVRVRVNDRGPFVPGRLMDLSYAAAVRIGMTGRGVVRARLWPCGKAR